MVIWIWAVIAGMTVREHAGNDKSCVWHASDYADGELKDEMFSIRFASVESECFYYWYIHTVGLRMFYCLVALRFIYGC